jgi:hypothetical protein
MNFVQLFYGGWSLNKTLKQAADDAYTTVHSSDSFFTRPSIIGFEQLTWQ